MRRTIVLGLALLLATLSPVLTSPTLSAAAALPHRDPGAARTWRVVSSGGNATCAIDTARGLYCWGDNAYGQLGLGFYFDGPLRPTRVGRDRWLTVQNSAGTTCGIDVRHRAYCWGENYLGSLGDGHRARVALRPHLVLGGQRWSTVSPGGSDTCGISTAGALYCWGTQDSGMLGDGRGGGAQLTPKRIGQRSWLGVHVGSSHTCAVSAEHEVFCWGQSYDGQTAQPGAMYTSRPTRVGSETWREISTRYDTTCGVTDGGTTKCWGWNYAGQVGDGTKESRDVPTPLANDEHSFIDVQSGGNVSCGLTEDGAIECWGANDVSQFGDGTEVDSPTPTPAAGGGTGWLRLAVGRVGVCALTTAKLLYCWGGNDVGQDGVGDVAQHASPVLVR